MILNQRGLLGMAAALAVAVAACGGAHTAGDSPTTGGADVGSGTLSGAGSTFVQPFFERAFYQYAQLHPQVTVNYQGVGSGAGIKQFSASTVDFGATDVPMNADEIQAAGGTGGLIQIPDTLGAVAIAYNVPGLHGLRLDGPVLAGIYLGRIKTWRDPAIRALNPGLGLPGTAITVVHRADGSGTTYIFTDYLSKISADWKSRVGNAKSVQWPVGVGGKGNQAVAQQIQQTPGAVGYVELAYVVQASMQQAYVENAAGKFLQASVAGATAAAARANGISATDFSIVNEPGDASYPIVGFSWVMLRRAYPAADAAKGRATAYLFRWFDTSGQQYGKDLQYAPLPPQVQGLALSALKTITVAGKRVLS